MVDINVISRLEAEASKLRSQLDAGLS